MANLQFDFLVDNEQNTITVKGEFVADRQLVWDCYTKSELLDQWFAPKPFTTMTKSMDSTKACLLSGLMFINAGLNKFFNYIPVLKIYRTRP